MFCFPCAAHILLHIFGSCLPDVCPTCKNFCEIADYRKPAWLRLKRKKDGEKQDFSWLFTVFMVYLILSSALKFLGRWETWKPFEWKLARVRIPYPPSRKPVNKHVCGLSFFVKSSYKSSFKVIHGNCLPKSTEMFAHLGLCSILKPISA